MNHGLTFMNVIFYHLQSLYFEICQIVAFLLRMPLFAQTVYLMIEGIKKLDRRFMELLSIALRFGRSCLDDPCLTSRDEYVGFNIRCEIRTNRNLKLTRSFRQFDLLFFHLKLLILKKNAIFLHSLFPCEFLINSYPDWLIFNLLFGLVKMKLKAMFEKILFIQANSQNFYNSDVKFLANFRKIIKVLNLI